MKLLLIISFGCLCFSTFAQSTSRVKYIRSVNDIAAVLEANYKPSEDSVNSACWEGCVFIKFNISDEKTFTNFSFTDTTPEFILLALHSAFKKMNALGVLTQLKSSYKGKTYILPFQIDYRAGCYPPGEGFDFSKLPKPTPDEVKRYAFRQLYYAQSQKSINNITNFTDGRIEAIECVLLAPHLIIRGGY
jgi:hypothetical protein